ncbi:hypothetical protein, partial [Bacillus cereus]|uniref:hypothetical protein n=1 Tax=Bacillus cereus TaxID=1396 RepID=UPI00284DF3F5
KELTEGSIHPKELLKVTHINPVHAYLLRAVQKVYLMQGIELGHKPHELMVRQILSKVLSSNAGKTDVLP